MSGRVPLQGGLLGFYKMVQGAEKQVINDGYRMLNNESRVNHFVIQHSTFDILTPAAPTSYRGINFF
ncbi:hypothetical protein [Larkinella punicea]|uniref:Uncharacterized protein n=1 Tax=Larkinella punicea TaxID=2315727 RepID=A0A368JE25_9BACT|nr:hypothetical protein [Larkinella punicea]RCR65792.1 hypothetical protein DUE52_30050 [Larkinella punicea]